MPVAPLDQIRGRIGEEVGVSSWLTMDQERIGSRIERSDRAGIVWNSPGWVDIRGATSVCRIRYMRSVVPCRDWRLILLQKNRAQLSTSAASKAAQASTPFRATPQWKWIFARRQKQSCDELMRSFDVP